MYPKLIPTAVRDNYDDDNLSDIDDEVFIRDGKSGILKIDDDCADKRPLMPPRRKGRNMHNMDRHAMPYKVLIAPFCYGVLALIILIALILLGIFVINIIFPMPLNLMRNWFSRKNVELPVTTDLNNETVACTFLTHEMVWTRTLPKFAAEAPLRKNDVNGDNVDDIIIGFSIGLDLLDSIPEYVCMVYFDKQAPCLGGVIALDGKTGETLWIHWTAHAIFSVDCGIDLTLDNMNDCVISGRGAILHAINGHDGSIIWEIEDKYASEVLDVYDAKYVSDLDSDGIGDVVASHIIQNDKIRSSRIILLSGKTGKTIRSVDLPESEQLFVAPQTLTQSDGENIFILATNSKKKSGGLYIIPESTILRGEMKLRKLHHGPGKGVSLPPILADINSDGTEDIIAAMFSSTIIAYDGITFRQLWNYTIPKSEIISIPIPGYYNDDDIPDFMVKHQIGPGFPVYYYTVATILDGKTGKPLLEKPMEDTMSAQMSGLSITVDDFGNDWFLHWSADCLNHENEKSKYQFVEEQDSNFESRADLCKLRFNSTLVTKLYAMSQHIEPPGMPLYSSEQWKKIEFANFGDPREEAEKVMEQRANLQTKKQSGDSSVEELTLDKSKESSHFYPRGQDSDYDPELNNNINLAIKAAEDELDTNNDWRNSYKAYDNNYEDRPISLEGSNDARSQRSGKMLQDLLNNENNFDTSIDYTNGEIQSRKMSHALKLNQTFKDYSSSRNNDFVNDEEQVRKKRDFLEAYSLDMDYEKDNNTVMNETDSSSASQKKKNDIPYSEVTSLLEDDKIGKIFKEQAMARMFHKRSVLRKKRDDKSDLMSGVQRQPPTGILLPSLKNNQNGPRSIDLVFSTYWLPASEIPFVLLQQDMECIQNEKAQLVNEPEKRDEEKIIRNCLSKRGIDYRIYQEAMDKENTNIALGQMTIYRTTIRCGCPDDMLQGQSCKNISMEQSWSSHLGKNGNGYFRHWRHK